MRTAVIYSSKTGFTKRYAQWLLEALGKETVVFTIKEAKEAVLPVWDNFDTIVYGGWMKAGSVTGADWFKKYLKEWASTGKKLALWATGGSPEGTPDVDIALDKLLTEEEHKVCKTFYCPGGFKYEEMSFGSKFLMKMFAKSMKAKAKTNPELESMANMIGHSYDISDKKYIDPILEYIQ